MKLLNHTSKYFALLLLPLITIWAVTFYYAMLDEIYDSLDDGLENQKILLLQRVEKDPGLLDHTAFENGNFSIGNISQNSYKTFKERYQDTMMYMQNEKDYEPVRVYESAFQHKNQYYKIKIVTSMVEEDDLIESLVLYLIALYVLLVATILILNNWLLKKIWQPFYGLIHQLRGFSIERDDKITPPQTNIEEFNLLNAAVERLTQKSRDSYVEQKQFIENASHELQTPLAISINKLELFLEKNKLEDKQMADLAAVLDNLGRLTRLNRSLLLLSKIENKQFIDEEEVDFDDLIQQVITDFEDLAEHKNIQIKFSATAHLNYIINKDLATILLTNLIKNALVHGRENETVKMVLKERAIQIQNSGTENALDGQKLFSRFKSTTTDKRSTGLGLAIAKAIADKYNLDLSYTFNGQHLFIVRFPENMLHR